MLYISRPSAAATLLSHAIPSNPQAARTWMDRAEASDRKNARVADRIRIAIPRELNKAQRHELVRAFCEDLTRNRVPWFAAIHQDGDDAHNPHAHIVVRDRDIDTGRRTLRWSDSARDRLKAGLPENAVETIRTRWEALANRALQRAGHDARIDRRSLEDQGIDRTATIHIGPNAAHIDEFVQRPDSKPVTERPGGRERVIDYPTIDQGRTRRERNAEIIDLNLERLARSSDWATRVRAEFQKEETFKDRVLERRLMGELRERTIEQRALRAKQRMQADRLRNKRDQKCRSVKEAARRTYYKARAPQKERHDQERKALKRVQNRIYNRVMRALDPTGNIKRRHVEERRALIKRQVAERKTLAARFRERRDQIIKRTESDCAQRLASQIKIFRSMYKDMLAVHRQADDAADIQRQHRVAERAQRESQVERQIKDILVHRQQAEFQSQYRKKAGGESAPSADKRSQAMDILAPGLKSRGPQIGSTDPSEVRDQFRKAADPRDRGIPKQDRREFKPLDPDTPSHDRRRR